MQPQNDSILELTNKASESIMRGTVVDLLEDAIALTKEGATPDQLIAFMRGICVQCEAARTLSMAHTGEDGRVGVPVGVLGVAARPIREDDDELEDAYYKLQAEYQEESMAWEEERAGLVSTLEDLQSQIAKLTAPKNGHRTVVEDQYDEDEEGELEEVVPTRKRPSNRERVREMLASRRSGRGFGRAR